MKVDSFDLQFIGQATFLITTPGGAAILTDPVFSESYSEGEQTTAYLTPPHVKPGDIPRCDALFVSHIHGDHFDPPSLRALTGRTWAPVWAAPEMTDALRVSGFHEEHLVPLTEGMKLKVKDVTATALAGYDNSADAQGRANKFSLLLECEGRTLLYCGDAHHVPAALIGKQVDTVISWPLPNEQEARLFHEQLKTRRYVLMHGDNFYPRKTFWCNFSYEEQKRRMEELLKPDYAILIPKKVRRMRK